MFYFRGKPLNASLEQPIRSYTKPRKKTDLHSSPIYLSIAFRNPFCLCFVFQDLTATVRGRSPRFKVIWSFAVEFCSRSASRRAHRRDSGTSRRTEMVALAIISPVGEHTSQRRSCYQRNLSTRMKRSPRGRVETNGRVTLYFFVPINDASANTISMRTHISPATLVLVADRPLRWPCPAASGNKT